MRIIHRDLKPENILITKNDNNFIDIKICDFGTAQIFKKGDIQKETIGSLYYVAPEVIQKNIILNVTYGHVELLCTFY